MSIFEILMLIFFGLAWPANIYKSIKSKSVDGKSVFFLYIIMTGYIMGIFHKAFYNYDFVIILYFVNLTMVIIDLSLYYKNKKLIKLAK